MKKKKKILHFRDNCIGCNSCTEHAPCQWFIDPLDGKARLKRATGKDGIFILDIEEFEVEPNKAAGRDCPVGIIRILDEGGKDITKK